MTIKDTIKQQIRQVIKRKYKLKETEFQVDYPPQTEMGDYSSNVAMVLAKQLKSNPIKIGQIIAQEIKSEMFDRIEVVKPGFINFYLNQSWAARQIRDILKQGKKFGCSQQGKGRTIVIDYSAPNIAKKMHIGHLRSTVIGAALYNLYQALGYRVIRDNHLGDWGTQFGKLIYQYKQVYGEKINRHITVDEMEKLYLDFHQQAKHNPELEEHARQELKKLQDKEKFNYQLWKLFYQVSLQEFKHMYKILGVDFDLWHGESFYHPMLKQVVQEALDKGMAKISQGAIIIDLNKYNLPPLLIQKSDRAYLYATTDLATIKYRWKKFKPAKNIYVVANQQSLHFEQLFKASQLLGYTRQTQMIHVKFGLILGKDGKKMSTREGGVVDLIDIIEQGIQKAKAIIQEKNKTLRGRQLEQTAQQIAVGAIKYNDLSQNRLTDIIFDWDKMLSLENGSSPYLQYTYVRIKSILKKVKHNERWADYKLLKQAEEIKLINHLLKYPEIIKTAAEEYKPNLMANYLEKLAAYFHAFYEKTPVIKSAKQIQKARIGLIKAVGQVMKNGLAILGIQAPDKM